MKKSIAFIGALFMGSIAFAQVNKNDTINKTASRKVLNSDVKNLPPDAEANAKSGEIKGNYHQKIKGEQSAMQKTSSDASAGKSSEIHGTVTQKGREGKVMPTDEQQYTIKQHKEATKKAVDSSSQNTKTPSNFIKVSSAKIK